MAEQPGGYFEDALIMNNITFATRRTFLNRGLTLLGGAATVPAFLERTACALAGPADVPKSGGKPGVKAERVLVVVQLAGGNDGLNTVIPVRNDDYYRARPQLGIPRDAALRLTDELGLHPEATGLKELYDEGLLSIVQSVGYPNPDRSHFKSTDIWMTADPEERMHSGWLGRYFDCTCKGNDPVDSRRGIALTSESPLALHSGRFRPVSFAAPDQLTWRPGPSHDGAEQAFAKLNRPDRRADDGHLPDGTLKPVSMLDYLQRTAMDARLSAEQIQKAAGEGEGRQRRRPLDFLRPGRTDLSQQLRMVARMIAAGLPTRVYYASMGGFDTHANQRGTHQNLMRQLGAALSTFFADLRQNGHLDRVLLMTFSEFGRRVAENASGGTDHGAAAPMFLAGAPVAAGLHGEPPGLADLDRGDLKWKIDFRQVYASVLSDWLKTDSRAVLGGEFDGLKLIRR
ncbi:MAG: DUF1501 domain-containing protein [Phycisphaerae bacterium]|nr:DUF1501 domain-containing protein [Phycisphaerae bacterium]NUQ46315.1 DUF1501 domain-containing protein [Phycisphaerae bacterium]